MVDSNFETRAKNIITLLTVTLLLGSGVLLPVSLVMRQASADPTVVTCIYIDPQSAIVGQQVTIRGYVNTCPAIGEDPALNGQEIDITLSDVAGNLADVILDPVMTVDDFGEFFATFAAPSDAAYWQVTAEFAGDATFLPSTGQGIFATAELDALVVEVSDGQSEQIDLDVPLTGFAFDAALNFDVVPQDYLGQSINATVSQCTTPDSGRYLPLSFGAGGDICLEIFPSSLEQNDNHPNVHVDISYAGVENLPDGYSENNIDLFYQNVTTDEITEITTNRDIDTQEISGTAPDIGRFIVGIGLHGEPPEDAIRQHIFVGDEQEVMFRNVTDTTNATAAVSISPEEITIGEPITVTINYTNGNLDINAIDELPVKINSTSSNPDYVTIILSETSENSGLFAGDLTLTDDATSGNSLHASEDDLLTFNIPFRDPTDARFKVVFNGVSEAGAVELSDVEITQQDLDDLVGNVEITPVVGLVNMTIVDATLDESRGKVNMTISYANALIGPTNDPSTLKIYHKSQGSDWDTQPPAPMIDTGNKLVSTTFDTSTSGLFVLAFPNAGIGGAGGGLGKPGIGVVVDFVASFKHSPPEDGGGGEDGGGSDGPTSHSHGGGGSSRSETVVINNQQQTAVTTFPESYFEENPLEKVEINNAAFLNAAGINISSGNVGQQIIIASSFSNHRQVQQHYSYIVAIIDEKGFAVDINWQVGTVEAGQIANVSISWMPRDSGNYTVKVFVWDDIYNPLPLSDVTISNIHIGS